MTDSNNTKKGFTLIELLVVIAVITLLSSIVMSSIKTARVKAKLAAIQQNLITLRTQAEIFRAGNGGRYNTTTPGTMTNNSCIGSVTGIPFFDDSVIKKTLSEVTKLSGGASTLNTDFIFCEISPTYYRVTVDMWNIGGVNTSVCMSNDGSSYTNTSLDEYGWSATGQPLCTP
jgi:prepilin-type N-terminal cleavage/methylation domain-containing protein